MNYVRLIYISNSVKQFKSMVKSYHLPTTFLRYLKKIYFLPNIHWVLTYGSLLSSIACRNLSNINWKVTINILNKKRNLTDFIFLSFLGIWQVRHIIHRYLLLLYMCIIRTYFPLDWAFKILYMLQKHVFACFARAQLCISSFACKLLCRHSTLIVKVNSCINFNFCITIIMLHLSKIRGLLKLWFFMPTLTSTNTLDVRF